MIEYLIYSAGGLLVISFGFTIYLDNKHNKLNDSYTEYDDEKDR